jgi:RNA polymerase sigma-70 factor (ECF subfamily)
MTDSDVSACLERVRQGDEGATRALIAYMYPLVYKIVRSNVTRHGMEEDLAQTVLTKVFKSLNQFSGRVPFKHWVSRIAVNACVNHIRYEKCRPEVRLADLSEQEAHVVEALGASDEALDAGLSFAVRDLVQHLVACLRPQERLLIRLIYLEGFTIQEASEATGLNPGAIAVGVSRAKIKMRARHAILLKGNDQ